MKFNLQNTTGGLRAISEDGKHVYAVQLTVETETDDPVNESPSVVEVRFIEPVHGGVAVVGGSTPQQTYGQA